MSSPRVSVIVPVFNNEPQLRECLASVLGQQMGALEIACVDDGSTDGSRSIIEALARDNPAIRAYLHDGNRGVGTARNTGLDAVGGDYLLFLDADDLLQPGVLPRAVAAAASGDLDILQVDFVDRIEDEEGARWLAARNRPAKTTASLADSPVLDGPSFLVHVIENGAYRPTVWSYLFRREYLAARALRFAGMRYHEDAEFVPRALYPAARVRAAAIVTHVHRRRRDSLMTDGDARNWLDSLEACVGIDGYFSGKDVDPRIRDRFATIIRDRLAAVLHWLGAHPDRGEVRSRVMETIERHGLRRYLAAERSSDGR